jgi:hypothetical protein
MPEQRDNDRPVTIGRYFNPADAHADRLALAASGIEAFVLDEAASSMALGIETRLQVRATDESAALALLRADPVPGSALPAALAESPCPKCRSADVSQAAEIPDVPSPPVEDWPSLVWRLRCAACHHSWVEGEAAPPGTSA